jgi:hypothetical protein
MGTSVTPASFSHRRMTTIQSLSERLPQRVQKAIV